MCGWHQIAPPDEPAEMTLALVLEYEASAVVALTHSLTNADYEVLVERQLPDPLTLRDRQPGVVIVGRVADLLEPADTCRSLRQQLPRTVPILVIGRFGDSTERRSVLDAGASDYLSPPVSGTHLVTRIAECLRSVNPKALGTIFRSGDVVLDDERHRVTRRGKDVHLSPGAYDLLRLFMSDPNHVFTREEILQRVWGNDPAVELRNVDIVLKRLREALRDGRRADPVETIRGVGYRMSSDSGAK